MTSVKVAAIDLGGTQIRAAIVDQNGAIVARQACATPAQSGPDAVIARLHALAVEVSQGHDIAGVGIAMPGPINTRTRTALGIPTLKGFDHLPLGERLEEMFGQPVIIENDAIAAAIGEWRFGAGRGCNDIVYVTVSTGIGGGVIINGKPMRGANGLAGHIGHMQIVENGAICSCGRKGCWEAYASGYALEQRTGRSAEHLFADGTSADVIEQEAHYLGVGIINLLHLFNPDRVVLGGSISQHFDRLITGISTVIEKDAMPAFRATPIVPADHIGNSGLLGAAALVFDRNLLA